jgi:regulator of sirC expression with transglutaminase-like and TPR domain
MITLLDDESPTVRQALQRSFANCLPRLEQLLLEGAISLDAHQEQLLNQLLEPVRREELLRSWGQWQWMQHANEQLEEALSQLSSHLNGWRTPSGELSKRLDALAQEIHQECRSPNLSELSQWLFGNSRGEPRLRGNSRDFYNLNNSNLIAVLQTGLGNPISLCCIYRLIGSRFGLTIEGCNFPGHFLASVNYGGQRWLVDCFNQGNFMLAEQVASRHPAANPALADIVAQDAEVEQIILRILRNLDEACDRSADDELRPTLRELVRILMDPAG